jgi:ubiquinone/menaquinone biosynthesis C-methylase UbiE
MTQVSALEGHRLWAPVYDAAINPLVALERRSMQGLLENLRPSTFLDIACGTGQWLRHFQCAGSEVFGIDASFEMLNETRKVPAIKGRVILAHAEYIPVCSSTSDLVLCSLSLGYFGDINLAFGEFARASKPGGYIAVSDIHPEALMAGWKRAFKLGRERYDIAHYLRTLDDIECAATNAGLKRKVLRTIRFGMPELPLFQRAGKEDLFWSAKTVPALFAGLWEKPC